MDWLSPVVILGLGAIALALVAIALGRNVSFKILHFIHFETRTPHDEPAADADKAPKKTSRNARQRGHSP